ncbi:neuromedin-U receptor 2-like [Stylophora pistillata]|uniref:neuromedin-U receptor 2-like n=1 Tax=Stylophora pistillata TaxID=50429 RepID=UPI000C055DB9|nr:neuromedin-U receptor 2-like [Stylophora pistillata]
MPEANASLSFVLTTISSEPVPLKWTLRVLYIFVFVVGIAGNVIVCAAVLKRRRLRTSNNLFTFNLACADLIVVTIYVPTQMTAFENEHNWALGDIMCRIAYIIIPLCLSASIGSLLAITVNRYRAIVSPLAAKLTKREIQGIIIGIWITSLVVALPIIFVAGEERSSNGQVYCSEPGWPKDSAIDNVYWISIFVLQYITPLVVICVLSTIAACKLRRDVLFNRTKRESLVITKAVRKRMQQGTKITKMLFVLVIIYAICMLPQHVVYFWMEYGNLNQMGFKMYIFRFSNVFPMANCALNPIAYGTLNKEFKVVFEGLLKRKWNYKFTICFNQYREEITEEKGDSAISLKQI